MYGRFMGISKPSQREFRKAVPEIYALKLVDGGSLKGARMSR